MTLSEFIGGIVLGGGAGYCITYVRDYLEMRKSLVELQITHLSKKYLP